MLHHRLWKLHEKKQMRGRPKVELVLNESEREQLHAWARRRKTSQVLALRSRIVLECARVLTNQEFARRLAVTP
jgi:hypothetical protein